MYILLVSVCDSWFCISAVIVFAWTAFYIGIIGFALIMNPSLIDTEVIWH